MGSKEFRFKDFEDGLKLAGISIMLTDLNRTNKMDTVLLFSIPSKDKLLIDSLENEIEQLIKLRTGQLG